MNIKKTKSTKVAILLAVYNGEKFLEEAIKSAINQTYKNLEIIFFDNNSSDKSRFIAKNFQDNRIKILENHVFPVCEMIYQTTQKIIIKLKFKK